MTVTLRTARRDRLAAQKKLAERSKLPGVRGSTMKEILEAEAAKPLRGGAKELTASSLFGDGHKQTSLF
jgi:hypothetical protein